MTTQQTIEINGKQAVVFVPELVEHLAVVDLNVIKRLAALLPTASLYDIKREMKDKISSTQNMDQYIQVLRDELSFHESVNLITLYQPTPAEPEL